MYFPFFFKFGDVVPRVQFYRRNENGCQTSMYCIYLFVCACMLLPRQINMRGPRRNQKKKHEIVKPMKQEKKRIRNIEFVVNLNGRLQNFYPDLTTLTSNK